MIVECRVEYYVSHATPYGRTELRFRAVATEAGQERVVAESPIFKGDAVFGPNPINPEHRAALAALVDRLRIDGWLPEPAPSPWFALVLRRGHPVAR